MLFNILHEHLWSINPSIECQNLATVVKRWRSIHTAVVHGIYPTQFLVVNTGPYEIDRDWETTIYSQQALEATKSFDLRRCNCPDFSLIGTRGRYTLAFTWRPSLDEWWAILGVWIYSIGSLEGYILLTGVWLFHPIRISAMLGVDWPCHVRSTSMSAWLPG